ncbi:hypothetical protein ACRE_001650 [Hapsidospora chrysogenum ATCC 11550]|uniref:LysM domain-containing protein n=1 Tax=Hapsidospora chrysogenum (strain ATCC 11550 / CBS 779.69 / DSM 880 / IAM 14645 / JCM 23072 / IMI 49137) TaxID=857340 RepID=A0A086TI13_HAPC1|nr:hypothetical protein ACRE_001650 [Hapsidospora chrysogenum ATCC 11550]
MESCCTCATMLAATPPYPSDSEKPLPEDRRVACCDRVICGTCIYVNLPSRSMRLQGLTGNVNQRNKRFAEYCPFCQVSSTPSSLPQGLRDPPSYASVAPPSSKSTCTQQVPDAPPPYTPKPASAGPSDEKSALAAAETSKDASPAQDTLHFLDHDRDTIASLSLRYDVPTSALRRANNITSDHLLLGRRTILIPGEYYRGGVSLSPRPVEGEDEELRKAKIRRFMTSCKVTDYDVAKLYLEQAGYDFAAAVDAYVGDEAWEREHPNPVVTAGTKRSAGGRKSRGPFWRGL